MIDRIAIDVMGGDFGPSEIILAAAYSMEKHKKLALILVGNEGIIRSELTKNKIPLSDRLKIEHAPEAIEMHESPAQALRNKKQSSMRIAIEQVKDAKANACVSAGNTGALMAISKYVLKMLPGIERPAICSPMPGLEGQSHLLDLGANVNPSSDQLLQFAVMGSELSSAIDNIQSPSIGLLNVGAEEMKGDDRVKQVALLLSNSSLNYVGFVEGTDIYTGKVNVIVTDGFTGNIAIKASEGVAKLFSHHIKAEFSRSSYGKVSAILSMPVLKEIMRKIDPRRYNGASLLGLRGIVVKSHGSADRMSFSHAIDEAILEVDKNVPEKISMGLEKFLNGNAII